MSDLHAAIMNLPCKHGDWSGENGNMAYKIGHRDARHAAAELASEYAASHQRLKEALWVCAEHNALHFGENHNTVIQAREALRSAP